MTAPGWTKITEKELDRLRQVESAHDAYLSACRVMAQRQVAYLPLREGRRMFYADGWLDCLAEFSQAVADAGLDSRGTLEAEPGHHAPA